MTDNGICAEHADTNSAAAAGGGPGTKPGTESSAPRRGLRFDQDEAEPGSNPKGLQPADDSLPPRLRGPPGLPPVHRAPSFKLQPYSQLGDGAQAQAVEGIMLPDGITAVPIVDPDNPDVITMQVCYIQYQDGV